MRLQILMVLIISFSSCKEKLKQTSELNELKTETEVVQNEMFDLTNVPDSLELIADKNLIGDFNGDNKIDFASLVKSRNNQKVGVLIIHNSENYESIIFGAGKEINQMTDLNWIDVFEVIPKGEVVSPTLVDEKTGDIIGYDESQNFELIGNGIYMSVEESHGGGIIFWNGKEYQWYHIE